MTPNAERTVSTFLARLTSEWVAYGSEGVSLRAHIHQIAHAHGADAEIAVQADSAVLSVHENGTVETITVVSGQQITRLDRFTSLRAVVEKAEKSDADLGALSDEIATISAAPRPYAEWAKALGIVLFTVGFSVNVQATWSELWIASVSAVAVALVVMVSDRVQRVSVLTPFLAAVVVSALVLSILDATDPPGGAILFMVPALFFFIPDDVLSASMFEMAAGRVTAGSAQFVYSLFALLLLYLGVLFGAILTRTPASDLFGEAAPADFPDIVGWLGWIVFTLGFMLAFSAPMRQFWWVLLVTLVAFGVQQGGTALFGEIVGTYLAAVAMILVAHAISTDPTRPPLMVLGLSGFFVLTVGALGLEGFTALASGDAVEGFTDLLRMLTIGTAIALGLLTGSVLIRRVTE